MSKEPTEGTAQRESSTYSALCSLFVASTSLVLNGVKWEIQHPTCPRGFYGEMVVIPNSDTINEPTEMSNEKTAIYVAIQYCLLVFIKSASTDPM